MEQCDFLKFPEEVRSIPKPSYLQLLNIFKTFGAEDTLEFMPVFILNMEQELVCNGELEATFGTNLLL